MSSSAPASAFASTHSSKSTTQGGGGASTVLGGLGTIPEEQGIKREIKVVRSRLSRVRILLDFVNLVTLLLGVVLISLDKAPFPPHTLRIMGGVMVTVSLVSIVAAVLVSLSLCGVLLGARAWWRSRQEDEEEVRAAADEEGEGAV